MLISVSPTILVLYNNGLLHSADESPLADKGPRTEMSCIVDVSMLCQAKELKKTYMVY